MKSRDLQQPKKVAFEKYFEKSSQFQRLKRMRGVQPSKEQWDFLQKARTIPDNQKHISCFAAFNHLRITRMGYMMPCCFATLYNQKWNKDEGLHHYWFEGVNAEYQETFLDTKLHDGCDTCKERLENKVIPPIVDYDWNVKDRMKGVMNVSYPKIIEFEISNLCNMECPMCVGYLSSKHAMNRDKHIDWGESIFDDDDNLNHLIEELKEFIPYLEEIRFVGGEPLAHKAMFKIAKIVRDIKPEVKLQVCTNGSIFNKQVKKLCEKNNVTFSFSLDTIIPEEYQIIRVGGTHKDTYDNVKKITDMVGHRNVTINSTLMTINCENIVQLIRYAYKNKYRFFLNTYARHGRVTSPDWGLHNISDDINKKVIQECKNLLNELEINAEEYKSTDYAEAKRLADGLARIKVLNDGYELQLKKIIILLEQAISRHRSHEKSKVDSEEN
tara:strand:- start:6186 stop:7508 length:1323 start_codon:yes stop_codon:yes gene_type:complete